MAKTQSDQATGLHSRGAVSPRETFQIPSNLISQRLTLVLVGADRRLGFPLISKRTIPISAHKAEVPSKRERPLSSNLSVSEERQPGGTGDAVVSS